MASGALRSRRVLVVEDEYVVAMSLKDCLDAIGAVVLGPAPSVEAALGAIASEPKIDVAVVDLNLGGVMAFAVADALESRGIPFVFTSGYEDEILRDRYPKVVNCRKPYAFAEMERALAETLGAGGESPG